MKNIISEYLSRVGWDVDNESFKKVQEKMRAFEQTLAAGGKKFDKFAEGVKNVSIAFIGLETAAVSALAAAATGAVKADMAVQIFARRLMTTVENARSLKAVMSAMGVTDMEQLKDVAANPTLRAQFFSLRNFAQGLEPNKEVQGGLSQFRTVGYQLQKIQLLVSYFSTYVIGYLGKILEGPLTHIANFLEKWTNRFKSDINQWAVKAAYMLTYVTTFIKEGFRIFAALGAVLINLRVDKWLKLIADVLLLIMVIIRTAAERLGVISAHIPKSVKTVLGGGAIGATAGAVVGGVLGGTGGIAGGPAGIIVGAATGTAAGTTAGAAVGAGIGAGMEIAKKLLGSKSIGQLHLASGAHLTSGSSAESFISRLHGHLQNAGKWLVTSGSDGHHAGGKFSHAAGYKFDVGLRGMSDSQIVNFLKGLYATPGFNSAHFELAHSSYQRAVSELKRQNYDTSKVGEFSHTGATGPHIDVSTRPININIYGGGGNPHLLAEAITGKLQTQLGIRSRQGVRP